MEDNSSSTPNGPSGGARKHLHHFLPVFQLQRFVDPAAGGVWVHDRAGRLSPNPKPLPPRGIAAQNELYTVETQDGQLSDAYENWLADAVDGPTAEAFPALLAHDRMTNAQLSAVARYVMSRDLRTPKARAFVLDWHQRAADAGWASLGLDLAGTRARIIADGGPDFTEEEIRYYLAYLGPVTANGSWLDFMTRHVSEGARRIFALPWLLLDAPIGQSFITSDTGIVKFRGSFENPVPQAIGWMAQADGWVMPLTPTTALLMAPGGPTGRGVATSDFLSIINRELARQASEFAFARERTPWVLRMWENELKSSA